MDVDALRRLAEEAAEADRYWQTAGNEIAWQEVLDARRRLREALFACSPDLILALCGVVDAADADHRSPDGDEVHAEGCCSVCDALAAYDEGRQ